MSSPPILYEPNRGLRRRYISVYDGAAAAMLGEYVRNYSPEAREAREWQIERTQGFRPLYRLNITPAPREPPTHSDA